MVTERRKALRPQQSRRYYLKNKQKVIDDFNEWRKRNPEKAKAQRAKYRANNKDKIKKGNRKWRTKNKQRHKLEGKERRRAIFLDVVLKYGGGCACCSEKEPVFLTVDHINGDGASHRKVIKAGLPLYRWLQKENYPSGFQILCWNCNSGRHRNGGVCPHKQKA